MKKISWVLALGFFIGQNGVWGQQVTMVKWPDVQKILTQKSDTTYIVNFWATWCKPCIAELPSFEQIQQNYKGQNVRVLLISMDFAKELKTRVIPFINQRKIRSRVWLLNEPDANSWIDKVSSEWSGAIPATLIVNNYKNKKVFFEQKLEYSRLVKELTDFL
ncbi:MAG: TlpA disulfide reductase family protein [Saprospiraceae bacterium]|jgi:thiol-disulfide isomerase/thioredoxin|uniref:TlpA disulfide reductase family protein n=1 Tax=Runella sp. TaxID=1960881 RepID=UPI002637B0EA|nr:TlpA disulfide reductase family protein [Runella sp.]